MATSATKLIAACALASWANATFSMSNQCTASSGPLITPVLELYTSEGCSSCPPADKWASTFKGKDVVVQAFHVGYWDYIGWVDRFATPAHTARQREVATRNRLRSIYTPQVVVNGLDLPQWRGAEQRISGQKQAAQVRIELRQLAADQFEAVVSPVNSEAPVPAWAAYWTVTEHGHNSKVKAGENAGEFLKHDFVVRQYTRAGEYRGTDASPKKLAFRSIAATPGHERQVNLVVFDPQGGKTLQALSLQCAG